MSVLISVATRLRGYGLLCGSIKGKINALERSLSCTGAVVGSITESFAKGSLRMEEPNEAICLTKAKQQHSHQVEALRSVLNGNVVVVPPYEEYPDIVFVDDPAFIMDGRALVTQMKPPTRAGEIGPMRETLEKYSTQLGIKEILQMVCPGAYLDAGDIMFTGREFLIGISQRTNESGIEEFAKTFPSWPVTGIEVPRGILHLKSLSSLCGTDTIAIAGSKEGQLVWKEIQQLAKFKYNKLVFPDNNGANCLFINGAVLHTSESDYPESFKVWETLDTQRISLDNSELAKADGSLTCNSVRVIETK